MWVVVFQPRMDQVCEGVGPFRSAKRAEEVRRRLDAALQNAEVDAGAAHYGGDRDRPVGVAVTESYAACLLVAFSLGAALAAVILFVCGGPR